MTGLAAARAQLDALALRVMAAAAAVADTDAARDVAAWQAAHNHHHRVHDPAFIATRLPSDRSSDARRPLQVVAVVAGRAASEQ